MADEKPRRRSPARRPKRSTGGRGYRFEPTSEQREKVEIWLGGGLSEEAVSAVLGIDRMTLRKHFAGELQHGRAKKRAEVIAAMHRSAQGGNVSAQKAYLALNDAATAEAAILGEDRPADRSQRLGKKEAARQAAENAGAGTEWGEDLGAAVMQ